MKPYQSWFFSILLKLDGIYRPALARHTMKQLVSIGISPKLNLRRYILNQVWARDEHDKAKSCELLGELRIKEQLNPGYPIRLKKDFPILSS